MSSLDVQRLAENGGDTRRLDADMAHVINVLAGMGSKPVESCRAPEARALPSLAMAVRHILRGDPDEMGVGMELRLIPGPTGDLRARLYAPLARPETPVPAILYLHDGGFVTGELDHYDTTPRGLAARTGAVVLASHYRQAPEHRFPAAHEDAHAAWLWLHQHAGDLGIDPGRIAIVGEGSGANLAIDVALRARDENAHVPRHIGLITPMAAMLLDLPSHLESYAGLPLSTEALKWASRKLFRNPLDARDQRMNPAGRSDLAGLPPVTVILAEIDPLRSEGEALADALRRSGVWVDATLYEGVTHGFFGLYQIVNKALFAFSQLVRNLDTALGQHSRG